MKKGIFLVVILLLVVTFAPCSPKQPASESLTVGVFEVVLIEPRVNFPNSIEFEIRVKGESDVSKITLQYQMDRIGILSVTSVVFPEFISAPRTIASWKWNMKETGGLPPGADIRYWWSIEDADGNKADTPVAGLSFDDGRYKWKELRSTNLTLCWYQGGPEFAQELVEAGEAALSRLEKDIGAQPGKRVEVYIYASTQDLQRSLIFPQEWTGGVAFTGYGVVALGISTSQLSWGKRAMAHEMAHLVIHQAILNGYGVILPTWLDEGLAMYAEGELSTDFADVLRKAAKPPGGLISVQSLCSSFPADRASATLAYAQSYSLVEYLLLERGGRQNMVRLLDAIRNGSSYTEALRAVYDLDIATLDVKWRQYLTKWVGN